MSFGLTYYRWGDTIQSIQDVGFSGSRKRNDSRCIAPFGEPVSGGRLDSRDIREGELAHRYESHVCLLVGIPGSFPEERGRGSIRRRRGHMDKGKDHHITLFDVLLVLIVSVSLCSVVLLTLHRFNPKVSLVLGLILTLLFLRIFGLRITRSDDRFGIGIFLILLLALVFRAEPYSYITGGWDPGLYTIMSSYYDEKGSSYITDNVRSRLNDDQKQFYDHNNHYLLSEHRYPELKGKYEGKHYPGVFIKDLDKSRYVFQFYPLHPVWMTIFSKFLGDENRFYSLVFFSLVSIIGFYLLAFEIPKGTG